MPESVQKVFRELTAAGLLSSDEVTQFDHEIAVGVEALLDRLVNDNRITRYQADKFLAGKASDIYFGDYIVLEEIGRGGMGTVLLARHRRMDREVAIKILPVTALDSESAVARFYQEVKIAAQLTHPNIVHAYDAGEHHGFHYLVMEYVRGHDLARVLEQLGSIPVSLALDYITQAAKGLEYAHRKGVVHRDIKPSNLLLDDEGAVKILDMGLARLGKGIGGAEVSRHLTTTGQVMGTVEYMSPEQAEDTRLADARSDIYSLGCTLYRLVTGQAPYARDTVVKTILAHREAAIPSLSSDRHPSLAHLESLFRAMVAKHPEDRIQTTTALIQELRRLAAQVEYSDPNIIIDSGIEVVSSSGSVPIDSPTIARYSSAPTEISYTSDVVSSLPMSLTNTTSAGQVPVSVPADSISRGAAAAKAGNALEPSVSAIGVKGVLPKKHRGKRILASGIISLLFSLTSFIGLIVGTINLVYSHNDVAEMRRGLRDSNGQTLTQAGRILSMIAVGIWGVKMIISMLSGGN